uniref:Gypsy retrotransposon integrase-like protein 1 n=1 Tax=Cyprinodon variegatus TaxID=28743 RepID=A0A3Q2DC58_CYPVA
MPFSHTDIDFPEHEKLHKSRRQRRREKLLGSVQKMAEQLPVPEVDKADMWEPPSNIRDLQKEDESLKELFSKATETEGEKNGIATALYGEDYFIRDGLLFHQLEGGSIEQVVVPQCLRGKVLALGHDVPLAGHLGNVKTFERIARRFYWPGLYTDVLKYCKSCPICQLTSSHKVRPSPLKSLPIIGVPFHRIGMDIVGPLERTRSGHRFILVVCDYATRYPEAFPLRKITAVAVARALLQLISRVGIPQEIITDQGTAFLSKTLKQVYSLLGIKGIRTTPYHPQTDGLVERYNRTLKS